MTVDADQHPYSAVILIVKHRYECTSDKFHVTFTNGYCAIVRYKPGEISRVLMHGCSLNSPADRDLVVTIREPRSNLINEGFWQVVYF